MPEAEGQPGGPGVLHPLRVAPVRRQHPHRLPQEERGGRQNHQRSQM